MHVWRVIIVAVCIGTAGCVKMKAEGGSSETNITIVSPASPSEPPASGVSGTSRPPSLSVTYEVRDSANVNVGISDLRTGGDYKFCALASHGSIAGRKIDSYIEAGFPTSDSRELTQLGINESGSPSPIRHCFGFKARPGSLPISSRVVERSAGASDMANDYEVKRNVVMQAR